MPRTMLTDQHWSKLENIFRNFRIYLKQNLRNFIEAILYRIRTGCPWRDLPAAFGKPNSIFKKFSRWSKDNKLLKIFKLISSDADLEWVFIDASHVRAHLHEQKLKENGLGYIDPKQNRVITTHGFRSTFRDWSADKTDYPREVCEHVLAHKLPDEVEAAYLRGAYLEKRKGLMADWAEFCTMEN